MEKAILEYLSIPVPCIPPRPALPPPPTHPHPHPRQPHSHRRARVALQVVQEIVASGANVVVSQGAISEMAMHFIERAGLMAVRLQSKFDNRRCATPCCILHAARSLLYVVRSMSRPAWLDVPSNLGSVDRAYCLACPVDCGVACCMRPGACCMCCNVHVSTCVLQRAGSARRQARRLSRASAGRRLRSSAQRRA